MSKYWARTGSVRRSYSNKGERSASRQEISMAAVKTLRKARLYWSKRNSLFKSGENRLIDDTCWGRFAACVVALRLCNSKNSDSWSYWKSNRIKSISRIEWTKSISFYSKFKTYPNSWPRKWAINRWKTSPNKQLLLTSTKCPKRIKLKVQ